MKIKKILFKILIFFLLIIPTNVFAYSKYIIPGGETIGIEVNSKGVLVVGFYKVDGTLIAKEAGFDLADIITKINDKKVNNINELLNIINSLSSNRVVFTVERDGKEKKIELTLKEESDVLKTGLYIKDKINGIGTLTYIDPKTKIFGSLGHEILDSKTLSKFEIKDGKIYEATVSNITKSRSGSAGEKNAITNRNNSQGTIEENELTGIFGTYSNKISDKNTIEVGDSSTITTGEAYIRTVIKDNEIEQFEINILSIEPNNLTKNILFEIKDEKLLKATGGIVQGMSGSPIIQNNKIIGAVNYVIVNDTSKGYGIFITTMLEEGDS